MTELMKLHENELANEGLGELKRISDIAIRILNKQVEILQDENAQLKDQLRLIVAGQKVDVTKKDVKEVLNGRDILQRETSR